MGSLNLSLDAKHDMWTYSVLNSVKWKYRNDPCCENEILAVMGSILINMKVELVPWFNIWYLNLFGFKFGKIKVLNRPLLWSLINGKFELVPWCSLLQTRYANLFGFVFWKWNNWIDPYRENEILVYTPTSLINGKFELVTWCETWYVNLFGFVFGRMKLLEWLCRENDILVYMPTSLINGKFELVPWCETWYVNLFGFVFGKIEVLEWLRCENDILVYMPTSLINKKFELVPWCETWYVSLFDFVFGKMKVLERRCLKKYLVLYSVKWMYWKVLICPWISLDV